MEKTQPVAGCSNNCDILSCIGEYSSIISSLYRRILNIILISSHTNKSNCLKGWWVGESINELELSEMQDARCEMLMDEVSLQSTIRRSRAKRCYRHVTLISTTIFFQNLYILLLLLFAFLKEYYM